MVGRERHYDRIDEIRVVERSHIACIFSGIGMSTMVAARLVTEVSPGSGITSSPVPQTLEYSNSSATP
jgi:hypothetical protein